MDTSKVTANHIPTYLRTVSGPLNPPDAGITDAHNHLWISPVQSVPEGAPVLNNQSAIAAELIDYRLAGGGTIVDCQPAGCGRDANILRELAEKSEVSIIACTGFHLRRYYPDDYWLFKASTDDASRYFINELEVGLEETLSGASPIQAGFIKIACENSIDKSPLPLIEAAVMACLETGAALEVHTEKGADAERIVERLVAFGLSPDRLILCHVDKRTDFMFHASMAQEGILLEYDTFYRPKYRPDENVWPLLEQMVEAGLDMQVAIATDMAEAALWTRLGNGPGLTGLIMQIIPRLETIGCGTESIRRLTGGTISTRLARPDLKSLSNPMM